MESNPSVNPVTLQAKNYRFVVYTFIGCKDAADTPLQCRWTRVHTRKLRSMQHDHETQKLVEVLRQVGGYAEFLETLLEHHSSNSSSGVDFRTFRPTVLEGLVTQRVRLKNVELDFTSTTEEIAEEWDEIDDPTKDIRLHLQKLTVCTSLLHLSFLWDLQ